MLAAIRRLAMNGRTRGRLLALTAALLVASVAGCPDDDDDVTGDDDTTATEPLEGLPTCDRGVLDSLTMDDIDPPLVGSEEYDPPAGATLDAFRDSVESLLAGRGDDAVAAAGQAGFELCRGADAEDDLAWWYAVGDEGGQAQVVFRAAGARPLILGNPHSWLEFGTLDECKLMFEQIGARALIITGTHRCANDAYTACDGTTNVCTDTSDRYRESDMAHVVDSVFQVAHEVLAGHFDQDWVISVHGFPLAGISVSNGTSNPSAAGQPVALFGAALADAYPGEYVTSCNEFPGAQVDVRYCGTTNVQGRQINGSPAPCTQAASSSVERFMHLEQTFAIWLQPQPMVDALDSVVPAP
jgi:hypothetical protein